jgi:DNA-binding transcriptional LysR family regulator
MDRITSMTVFDKVVETQSFSAAARQMRLSQAAVSKHVQALEDWLGARLINRTTRRISLTDFGAAFHRRCARVLEDLEEAKQAAGELQTVPKGTLRMTAPISFGKHIEPIIADFMARYPDVAFEVALTDRRIDLVQEGFDLAIRVGRLPDSSLIMRSLATSRYVLCAAPAYIERYGKPLHPSELVGHRCLQFSHHTQNEWKFTAPEGEISIPIHSRFKSNNADLLLAAARDGQGIMLAPSFHVGRDLRLGRLMPLLEQYVKADATIHAAYPHSRHLSAKVRCFVDFMAPCFKTPPWE